MCVCPWETWGQKGRTVLEFQYCPQQKCQRQPAGVLLASCPYCRDLPADGEVVLDVSSLERWAAAYDSGIPLDRKWQSQPDETPIVTFHRAVGQYSPCRHLAALSVLIVDPSSECAVHLELGHPDLGGETFRDPHQAFQHSLAWFSRVVQDRVPAPYHFVTPQFRLNVEGTAAEVREFDVWGLVVFAQDVAQFSRATRNVGRRWNAA